MGQAIDEKLIEQLNYAVVVEYKGVLFDNWTVDEYGIWGEICEDCAQKYKDVFTDELEPGGVGACSVRLCDVVGMDSGDKKHFYVDFHPELVKPLSMDEFYRLYPEQQSLDERILAAQVKMHSMPGWDDPDRSNWDFRSREAGKGL